MSLLIKICGLRDEEHVAAAVEAGAGAIGFVFAESVRRVTPAGARAASAAVPDDVLRVAVMLHPSNEEWLAVLREFQPDVLQTDAEDFAALDVPMAVQRWPVYRERGRSPDTPGTYIYEGAKSGAGETVDWKAAADHARIGRMILAGGLDAANVADAVRIVRPFGVDVSSAVESAPGEKDSLLIREFVNAAQAAEKML
jgi:phosphoribosylanthranilate isomerase